MDFQARIQQKIGQGQKGSSHVYFGLQTREVVDNFCYHAKF
jgi:hypothetical protein